MPDRSPLLTGRPFTTVHDFSSEPEWGPLERLARMVWQLPDIPRFHPGEFMYMMAIRNDRLALRIHLYKHRDTRAYLNLDDAGHAYAYGPSEHDVDRPGFSGQYRRYRDPVEAIAGLRLWEFEGLGLFRSFPPEEWPEDGGF